MECDAGEDIRAIDGLLRALEAAVVGADPEALDGLLCRDVVAVFSGRAEPVRGRAEVVGVWRQHMARWSGVRIDRRGTFVRVHGDVAWANFLWDGEGWAGGRRYRLDGERWTVVLLWEEGGWKLAQTHTSLPYSGWEAHRVGA